MNDSTGSLSTNESSERLIKSFNVNSFISEVKK